MKDCIYYNVTYYKCNVQLGPELLESTASSQDTLCFSPNLPWAYVIHIQLMSFSLGVQFAGAQGLIYIKALVCRDDSNIHFLKIFKLQKKSFFLGKNQEFGEKMKYIQTHFPSKPKLLSLSLGASDWVLSPEQ